MKARKPNRKRKNASIRLRLTAGQKTILAKAAARAGLALSGWLRFVALREAEKGAGN